jgi:histidyl-tRNA synthetase
VPELAGDVEVIEVAHRLFTSLGATESMFTIRVNDRVLLNEVLGNVLRNHTRVGEALALIDRKAKMPIEEFNTTWEDLASVSFDACFTESQTITTLLLELKARGIQNTVFDPSIVRGFTYYTGIVFEVFDTHPDNNRSMMGGGRYDTLVEKYGSESLPACGFGLGDVTLSVFLEVHHLVPSLPPAAHLYLAPIGVGVHTVVTTLRNAGVNVAVGMKHEKIADHIRNADKLGIPYFAVYGDTEAQSGELAIKHLTTGTETRVRVDKVHEFLIRS